MRPYSLFHYSNLVMVNQIDLYISSSLIAYGDRNNQTIKLIKFVFSI